MGAMQQVLLSGGLAAGADPYFGNVGILMHYDGTAGTSTLVDSSSYAHTPTVTGVEHTSTQSVYGGSSASVVTVPGGRYTFGVTSAILASGSTPWTWEADHRSTTFAAAQVVFDNDDFGTNNTGWQIYVGTDGKIYLYSGTQAINYGGYGSGMSLNTWYKLRIVWDGTLLYFFIDGSLVGTSAAGFANVWGASNNLTLLNSAFNSQPLRGFQDELRWTKGVARSIATYTPAAAAFPNY